MNIKKIVPIVIIAALFVTGVAYAGYLYAQGKKTVSDKQNNQWQNQGGKNGAGMRRGGGMVAGEIAAMGVDNLTLKLPEGGSKIVFFSNTTKVVLYSDINASELAVGDKVVVIGNNTDEGGLTAVSVQVGAALNKDFAPGGAARQNVDPGDRNNAISGRGGAAQNMDFSAGEIVAIKDKSITVKTSDGDEKSVALAESTKYSKMSDLSVNDLAAGKIVVVTGTANTDGSATAQSIQIRPELPLIPKQNQLQNVPQKNMPASQNNQGGNGSGGGARFHFDD